MTTKQIAEFNICYRAFIRLLKNKHLYLQYFKNFGKYGFQYTEQELISFAHNRKTKTVGQHILSKAFTWSSTQEGCDVWRMVHTEWIRNYLGIESDDCSSEGSSALAIPIRKQI